MPGDYTGCIVYTYEEFKAWVAKNMVALVRSGRWFDKDAFKEIGKILKNKNTVCAIIPEDEEHVMAPLMFRFFQAFEEQEHGVLRNRNIFLGIQVLIGDSDDVEETPMPTPTSKPKAPKAPKMTPTSELSPPSSPPRDPLTEFYESRLKQILKAQQDSLHQVLSGSVTQPTRQLWLCPSE
jgi:hypothetical protein